MCSSFRLNKTIQNVTQEIITIVSLYEYPQNPFIVKGYLDEQIIEFESLESDVFFFQDLIEMWYIDRKHERWILEDIAFSQRVLFNLKNLRLEKFSFVQFPIKQDMDQAGYKKVLLSYIEKLHLIKCSLVKWLKFLYIIEGKIYDRLEIHECLRMVFKESVDNS